MTADELLLQAIAAGLTVEADGERLLVRPKGQVADELRTALVAQRGEVLAALAARTTRCPRSWRACYRVPAPTASCCTLACICLHYQATMPEPGRLVPLRGVRTASAGAAVVRR